jgi:hypothetical protein
MLKMHDIFRWTALFASVVLIVAVAGAVVSSKPPSIIAKQETAAEDGGKNAEQKDNKTLWDAWFPDSISVYTLFLVVFTAVLALGGIYQLRILNRAEIIAARSANAAKDSAEAAKQSAEVAQTALVTTQRAFLYINIIETHVINREVLIMPQWRNSGTTRASPVTNYVNWKTFESEPPSGYTYPDLAADGSALTERGRGITFYMGPQDTSYAETLKIPVETMEKVRSRQLRLFIWGWAQYRDVFKDTPLHETTFCNEVVVTDMGTEDGKATIAASFSKYGPHNTAD